MLPGWLLLLDLPEKISGNNWPSLFCLIVTDEEKSFITLTQGAKITRKAIYLQNKVISKHIKGGFVEHLSLT
jgi:hypothetical protein